MISTRWAVPIRRMWHWLSSFCLISLCSLTPALAIGSKSSGWFRSPLTTGPRQTTATSRLSRNTVPIPPRPACFRRMAPRRLSNQEKLSMPIRLCSAAAPLETTEMLTRSASSSAYRPVRISASTWLAPGRSGAASTRRMPFWPSMNRITSWSALPCSSRASKPENLSRGPK